MPANTVGEPVKFEPGQYAIANHNLSGENRLNCLILNDNPQSPIAAVRISSAQLRDMPKDSNRDRHMIQISVVRRSGISRDKASAWLRSKDLDGGAVSSIGRNDICIQQLGVRLANVDGDIETNLLHPMSSSQAEAVQMLKTLRQGEDGVSSRARNIATNFVNRADLDFISLGAKTQQAELQNVVMSQDPAALGQQQL